MAISRFFERILRDTLDDNEGPKNDTIEYTVSNDGVRRSSSDIVTSIRVDLPKPMPSEELGPNGRDILSRVRESFRRGELGIAESIISRLPFRNVPRIGRRRSRGTLNVDLGDTDSQNRLSVTDSNSLRNQLEIATRRTLAQNMQRPAAPLRYRTGRFANSVDITNFSIQATDSGREPRLSIGFSYMLNPYAAFDPAVSTRPDLYNRPRPGARNPRVLISDAITESARRIISSRFRLDINQR